MLALEAAEHLGKITGLTVVVPPELSLFAFHMNWSAVTLPEQNNATRDLLDRVLARGQVMLSGCTADGQFLGRVCILSFRTRQQHMELAVKQLAEETIVILKSRNLK